MPAMSTNTTPDSRHDQAVQRLMVASTSSNLSAVLDMLMLGISLEDTSVPPAAAEYARRFAQHDLSLKHCCGPTGWANTGPAPRWPGSRPPMRRPCAPGGRDRRNRAQQLYPHAQLAAARHGQTTRHRSCVARPATNLRQRPRLRYLSHRLAQHTKELSAPVRGPGVGYLPPGHAGRPKARYSLAVTTASAGQVRISAGSGTTWRENNDRLPEGHHRRRGQARNWLGGA